MKDVRTSYLKDSLGGQCPNNRVVLGVAQGHWVLLPGRILVEGGHPEKKEAEIGTCTNTKSTSLLGYLPSNSYFNIFYTRAAGKSTRPSLA